MMSEVFRRVYYCVSFKLEIEPRASCVLDTAQLLHQMNESSYSCLVIRTMPNTSHIGVFGKETFALPSYEVTLR